MKPTTPAVSRWATCGKAARYYLWLDGKVIVSGWVLAAYYTLFALYFTPAISILQKTLVYHTLLPVSQHTIQ